MKNVITDLLCRVAYKNPSRMEDNIINITIIQQIHNNIHKKMWY